MGEESRIIKWAQNNVGGKELTQSQYRMPDSFLHLTVLPETWVLMGGGE